LSREYGVKIGQKQLIGEVARLSPTLVKLLSAKKECAPHAWVPRLIERFRGRGDRLAIVSSSPTVFTEAILKAWEINIKLVRGFVFGGNFAIEHGLRYKPNEEPWMWTLRQMGQFPQAAVIAEGNPLSIPRPLLAMLTENVDVYGLCFVPKDDETHMGLARKRLTHAIEETANGNTHLKHQLAGRIAMVSADYEIPKLFK